MKDLVSRMKIPALLAVVVAGFIACGAGGNTGRLSLFLTDASTDQYDAVYVTVKQIDVHLAADPEDTWTTVATPNKTYDLLALANGVREQLGLVELAAGHYTQMRLILGDQADGGVNILSRAHPSANYVIYDSNKIHDLKVPSGMQTGVKIVQGFDINENSTTELTLDFDASRSVVVAGRSGKYLLKPTIRVLDMTLASIVNGTVTTKAADQSVVPVEGALVSAQVYDALAADPKDLVAVRASSLSDAAGAYKFFIAAGPYNLVASKLGVASPLAPSPVKVTAVAGEILTQDFSLVAVTDVGTVAGAVNIADADNETFVTISFRQTVTVGSENIVIEVASVSVANGGSYSVVLPVLPAGVLYSVVSSTSGRTTQQADVTVTKDTTTTLDISFL